jgi:mono/diheme cytochrome c family protein
MIFRGGRLLAATSAAALFFSVGSTAQAQDAKRGQYVFNSAGCYSCHTEAKPDAAPLAGARGLKTPFGIFYGPNLTPDPVHGIGKWTEKDLFRAIREGTSPAGDSYYPVFPFPSYAGMTDQDIRDLWAYLRTVPAVAQPDKPHELNFPFSMRLSAWGWQLLFFDPKPFKPDPKQSPEWNRGAYLVRHLGHCGECHTPRDMFGAPQEDKFLAGNPDVPKAPNIRPGGSRGVGTWSKPDLTYFLETGMTPDNDFAGSEMADVIKENTSKLTAEDRTAIATFILALPPIK